MKIALIGATGYIGSAVLKEALDRGHQVTAIARHIEKLPQRPNLTPQKGDVQDESQVVALVAGHEAVISAFSPGATAKDIYSEHLSGYRNIIQGVKDAGVKRLLIVGGASSLEVAPGVQMIETPEFPEDWKPGALATREVLYMIRNEHGLDWTYLSPSMMIVPGERTGKFRLGKDQLLKDADGESHISLEDYAVAMVDELEIPKHTHERFTVGY